MVIPVEQVCPICGDHFMGSDVVGMPCMNCQGLSILDEESLTKALGEITYGPYRIDKEDPDAKDE